MEGRGWVGKAMSLPGIGVEGEVWAGVGQGRQHSCLGGGVVGGTEPGGEGKLAVVFQSHCTSQTPWAGVGKGMSLLSGEGMGMGTTLAQQEHHHHHHRPPGRRKGTTHGVERAGERW